ncbi:unnamed protein product [Chrysoparadoxa australica]
MNTSDEHVWAIVGRSSCFQVKRNGKTRRSGAVTMSSHPLNLMNVSSFKYSGLANSKAVGVTEAKDAEGHGCAMLSLKSSKKGKTPAKSVGRSLLKKNHKAGAAAIRAQTAGSFYREDLTSAALARWSRVNRAVRTKKGVLPPMPIKEGRGSQSS